MKLRQSEHLQKPSRTKFRLMEPLLAVSIAIPLLLGCKEQAGTAEQSSTPAQSAEFMPEPEIPHFIPSGPAYKTLPSQGAPNAAQPAPEPSPPALSASPPASIDSFSALNDIIARRVAQSKTKMKLTPDEGRLAEGYLRSDLPLMPTASALAGRMPKTTIEIIRAIHERNVTREDAEGMAAYLNRMLDSMHLSKLDTFDDCCSHVLGRRWDQIDYSGEGQSWQSQERLYSSRGAPDLLTAEHVRKYFAVESRMPYFRRIFNPQGPLPE
jgi:hypothetical protein